MKKANQNTVTTMTTALDDTHKGSSLGTPPGSPLGTPLGTPLGALLRTSLGTPLGTSLGTPLGTPSSVLQPLSGWHKNKNRKKNKNKNKSKNNNGTVSHNFDSPMMPSDDNPMNNSTSSQAIIPVVNDRHQNTNQVLQPWSKECNEQSHVALEEGPLISHTERHPSDSRVPEELQSLQFQGKAKFKDAQPTLVLQREFDIVHKALTLQQQRSCDEAQHSSSSSSDSPTDCLTTASLSASSFLDSASVTSDFIAWLDTPLSLAATSNPPLVTFSKEEKGQPVTVVFYHDKQQQDYLPPCCFDGGNGRSVLPASVLQHRESGSAETGATTSRQIEQIATGTSEQIPVAAEGPLIPTSKVTLKFSAGVCLLRKRIQGADSVVPEVLVIRRSSEQFYELPKGHLEKGESLIEAASRELVEETGIKTSFEIGLPLLSERYVVKKSASERLEKSVHYFRARLLSDEEVLFGEREEETKELKWIGLEEAKEAFWKSNAVRSVVMMALTASD